MIKINLSRTRIAEAEALESAYQGSTTQSEGTSGGLVILLKVVILVGGIIALNFYESQNLDKLNLRLQASSQNLLQLQTELTQKQNELNSIGSIEEESKVLHDKMALLKNLSKLRLREVKSLDYIQSIVPQRVWLTDLLIEQERYLIKGKSRNAVDVSQFVRKLEDGGYFSDVVLIQDSPVVENGVENREFEILARSEVIN